MCGRFGCTCHQQEQLVASKKQLVVAGGSCWLERGLGKYWIPGKFAYVNLKAAPGDIFVYLQVSVDWHIHPDHSLENDLLVAFLTKPQWRRQLLGCVMVI